MKPKKKLTIGHLAAAAAALYLAVLLVQTIKRNHDLKQQVASLEFQIQQLQTEKTELGYKLQYFRTESFKEKEARAKLGLQAPGEGVIILPKRQPAKSQDPSKAKASKSNWQQWQEFLFG